MIFFKKGLYVSFKYFILYHDGGVTLHSLNFQPTTHTQSGLASRVELIKINQSTWSVSTMVTHPGDGYHLWRYLIKCHWLGGTWCFQRGKRGWFQYSWKVIVSFSLMFIHPYIVHLVSLDFFFFSLSKGFLGVGNIYWEFQSLDLPKLHCTVVSSTYIP